MNLKPILAAVALSGAAILALSGCANQTTRDLEKIPVKDPDKAELYVNVDLYPNIVRLCIDGVAFATTTRDASPAALTRVPEWDHSFCGAPAK